MKFSRLADYFSKIEATPKRLEMTDLLAKLLKEATSSEIDKICYLALGQLAPLYEGVEFNLAEKMMVRIMAEAYDKPQEEVRKLYKKKGDLGEAAEELGSKFKVKSLKLTVDQVYRELRKVAEIEGAGSQEKKVKWAAELLKKLDPLSTRFVTRIPVKKLRLGFSDKTILDALSVMEVGDKSARAGIERAYNVLADIGKIAQLVKTKGVKGLAKIKVSVGTPVRMAAAERLPTPQEIIDKMGGRLAAEPKYDGFRVQLHLDKSRKLKEREGGEQLALLAAEVGGPWVKIFSRNLEDTTAMFPEIVAAAQKLPAKSVIMEGEAIAYNPETEEFEPFQETAKRKRKYDVMEKAEKLPLKVFAFDLLYLDGRDLTHNPYSTRRGALEKLVKGSENTILIAEEHEFKDAERLQEFFMEQVEHGLEGIMTKRLDGVYQAGVRNFNWVKLKRVEEGELEDTIDCVVLGYYRGRGKRAEFGIGGFLVAVYDDKADAFKTISRVGTGLKDEEWREMKRRVDKISVKEKPKNVKVVKELVPDVWAAPQIVVAIRADEITRSPLHTAGARGDEPGLALRFPRLMAFRNDKAPEQATTVLEVEKLFKKQRKR
ncbi:ATP-dependent DNA ligase [Candidatus Saccharibacteria bacterium]|nr:ATP-dependent DNA ligase [Candidatus Saccharibacteria bacterium]